MTRKERALLAIEAMKKDYPDAKTTLDYEEPFQLLFATRLAAQCTDERVNKITPKLFATYPTLDDYANANVKDVEKIVRSCGLGPTKAKDLVEMSKILIEDFDSEVPGNMEDLLTLPGIGRKTANVVLGDVFGLPAIPTDTHCIRITNLLGLAKSKNPLTVERQLEEVLPPEETANFCHRMVLHGRAVCVARRPDCANCSMYDICLNSPLKKEEKAKKK